MLPAIMMLSMLLSQPPPATSADISRAVAINSYYCNRIAGLATTVAAANHDNDLAEASQLVEAAADARSYVKLNLPIAADQRAQDAAGMLARKVAADYAKTQSRDLLERELVSCAQHL